MGDRAEVMKDISKKVAASYDEMADDYFTETENKSFHADYERPAMLELLGDVKGKKILEPGCASGWYTKYFIDNGAEVTAFDISPKLVKLVKKRVGDKAEVFHADLNSDLEFIKDNEYDVIFCSLVLHYIEDWDRLFDIFNKKLNKNGVVVFSTHHPLLEQKYFDIKDYYSIELLEDEWEIKKGKPVKVHFFRRGFQNILNPIINAGFEIKRVYEPRPLDSFKDKSPQTYEKMKSMPWFLFMKVMKK